jgi:hypothetical protein
MWRHGPVGFDPLCNGCGVKWKRGRILRGHDTAVRVQKTKQSSAKPAASGIALNNNGSAARVGTVSAGGATPSSATATATAGGRKIVRKRGAGESAETKDDGEWTGSVGRRTRMRSGSINSGAGFHASSTPSSVASRTQNSYEAFGSSMGEYERDFLYKTHPSKVVKVDGSMSRNEFQSNLEGVLKRMGLSSERAGVEAENDREGRRKMSPCASELTSGNSRTEFLTAALDIVPSDGLLYVASALRRIAVRSYICGIQDEEEEDEDEDGRSTKDKESQEDMVEFDLDLGELSLGDWRYLCHAIMGIGA